MRQALRSLARAKTFSLVAIATLAVGIGATTAVFSVVDAVLLKPLPFVSADRIVTLARANAKRGLTDGPFSYPAFVEIAARDRMFSGLAAYTTDRFNVSGVERPEQLSGARVSAALFDVLGIVPALGRGFAAGDDEPGAAAVAILGRRYWTRRFSAAPAAVGGTVTLNGAPYQVVGVLGLDLPPPFDDVDVWTTHVDEMSSLTPRQVAGGLGYLSAIARLAPGVALEQAQAEADAIEHAYARANPTNTDADPDASLHLAPIRNRTVGDATSPILVLAAAVGLVLLVACANVANLLLVRATARSQETAIRLALGAGRADVIRWLTAESLVLAVAGGIGGVLIAQWSVALASTALTGLPRGSQIAIDARVLLFSLAVSLGAGVVFGLVPATRAMRQPAIEALKGNRRTTSHRSAAARALIVGEVALSLMLLVGAGLLLQGFVRLTAVPLGFAPDGLVTMQVSLPMPRYADPAVMRAFVDRVMGRIERTPGVASAAASMALPPTIVVMAPYLRADQPAVGIGERPVGQWSAITPRYFRTLGVPIVEGRAFTDRDTEDAPLVCIVSRGLARRAWPNESAIGRKLLVGRAAGFAEVVGVAGDVKNNGLANEPMPAMYTPYPQRPWPSLRLAVRAAGGDPLALAAPIRAAVFEADRDQPVTNVETMAARLSDSVASARLIVQLIGAFAAIALVMAAAGLYGVIAYTVEQRTREIGVRMALGADPRAVLRLVVFEGARLTAVGIAAGTIAAAVVSRTMRGLLFGVSPADPMIYAGVVALFAVVAAAACLLPARRALRVDPLMAIRAE
jgi:putative ABC transport system permease protein